MLWTNGNQGPRRQTRLAPLGLYGAIVAVLVTALGLTPVPPPTPPLGWEDRVTPGFDPRIESTVVKMSRWELRDDADLEAPWEQWGDGAVDVLLRLMDDESWKDFRIHALRLLVISPEQRARRWVDETARTLITKTELSETERWTHQVLLLLYTSRDEAAEERLIDLALSEGSALSRRWAISRLIGQRTGTALNRAVEAIAELPEEERDPLMKSVEEARGYVRAQEPMDVPSRRGDLR